MLSLVGIVLVAVFAGMLFVPTEAGQNTNGTTTRTSTTSHGTSMTTSYGTTTSNIYAGRPWLNDYPYQPLMNIQIWGDTLHNPISSFTFPESNERTYYIICGPMRTNSISLDLEFTMLFYPNGVAKYSWRWEVYIVGVSRQSTQLPMYIFPVESNSESYAGSFRAVGSVDDTFTRNIQITLPDSYVDCNMIIIRQYGHAPQISLIDAAFQ
jgi:hypothetical protein